MLAWIKRLTRQPGFKPTALVTLAVTFLSDVPEFFPLGQELGITVMGVGYSYIAACIFNVVIVEIPRAKELQELYRAAKPSLHRLGAAPSMMINGVFAYTGKALDKWEADSPEEIAEALAHADWDALEARGLRLYDGIRSSVDTHQEAYAVLIQWLGQFEPSVRTAIVHLGAARVHEDTALPNQVFTSVMKGRYGEQFARRLFAYQQSGDELREAMRRSPHM